MPGPCMILTDRPGVDRTGFLDSLNPQIWGCKGIPKSLIHLDPSPVQETKGVRGSQRVVAAVAFDAAGPTHLPANRDRRPPSLFLFGFQNKPPSPENGLKANALLS
ncbi:hypothetical protein V6N11_055972 [Hibiscus sabdariffa]|uniref:Uncharacterized protein n=1 Tax=Hibiscus sabdariffa TaxID=183260 RepID=A0ABR2T2G1_9ROSI